VPATLWRKLQALSATDSSPTHGRRCDAGRHPMVRKMLSFILPMNAEAVYQTSPSVSDAEPWLSLSVSAVLLIVGASRRSPGGACLAASAAPLLYRGITGRWPAVLNGRAEPDNTGAALAGDRGIHVRELSAAGVGRAPSASSRSTASRNDSNWRPHKARRQP
jgi:hypothetical protein